MVVVTKEKQRSGQHLNDFKLVELDRVRPWRRSDFRLQESTWQEHFEA